MRRAADIFRGSFVLAETIATMAFWLLGNQQMTNLKWQMANGKWLDFPSPGFA
jgi:hypothetical protein